MSDSPPPQKPARLELPQEMKDRIRPRPRVSDEEMLRLNQVALERMQKPEEPAPKTSRVPLTPRAKLRQVLPQVGESLWLMVNYNRTDVKHILKKHPGRARAFDIPWEVIGYSDYYIRVQHPTDSSQPLVKVHKDQSRTFSKFFWAPYKGNPEKPSIGDFLV